MADEMQRSDSLSSVTEEGDTLSPPEIVSHPKDQDLPTNQSSDDLQSSSQSDVVEKHPDSVIPIPVLVPNSQSPTGDDSIPIPISDSLILNKKVKETSFSEASAKLNVGGGSISILGLPGRDQKRQLGKMPVQSLEIQVIDETALIGPISMPKLAFKRSTLKTKNPKEEDTAEKKKAKTKTKTPPPPPTTTRRGAKSGFLQTKKKKNGNVNVNVDGNVDGNVEKMRYSRKAMEALRFENVVEQRRMWKNIYNGLGPLVRKEYDFLLSSKQDKNVHFIFHDAQQMKNESAPSDFGKSSALDSHFFSFICSSEFLTWVEECCSIEILHDQCVCKYVRLKGVLFSFSIFQCHYIFGHN